MKFIESTKKSRNAFRINGAGEIADSAVSLLSQGARIPFKVAQMVTSIHSFFQKEPTKFEKCLHLAHVGLIAYQVGILIYLASANNQCKESNGFCLSLTVCDLIYDGLLLASIGLSELKKRPYDAVSMHHETRV